MSYQLNAAVGPFDLLRGEEQSGVVPLRHRMGLVPLPRLSAPAEERLRDWSLTGTIGQVEADFFGGDGWQTASLWRGGQRVWGPSHTAEFPAGRRAGWPINAVLARLGVVLDPRDGRPEHHDLFAEVGLGAERDLEGWSRRAAEAREHATYDAWQAGQAAAERAAAERAEYARLADVPVPLGGAEVMEVLGIPPGRQVGAAIRFLQNLHVERGELSRADAIAALRSWGAEASGSTTDR
ncbi:hypothetical protein [Actinoplanes sp. RD1]|uniref:hypothetical protein n=1 Tax=Actinoplanes sp. RD1 TaxID=3064538 RepID=UPI002740371C|nr:hypothetical protein [Actinoplanes sp. RD1]